MYTPYTQLCITDAVPRALARTTTCINIGAVSINKKRVII
jgi:hypothetical protein